MGKIIPYIMMAILILQCTSEESKENKSGMLFESLDASQTNIDFENQLQPREDFNMYIFRNFYNGGGVAAGDVNNDGFPDLFFTGNMTSNRLYINQGDFNFLDVTDSAVLNSEGYWSTGASMVDVNGDGYLDIYVTLSGPPGGEVRHNRLYINNGDSSENKDGTKLTFTESALEYNLVDEGLSTHGVFFDYNKDGLLDLYLVSNSFHDVGGYENVTGASRKIPDPRGASKLYRNDGDTFTDVTEEAGIYSSVIGFGLSAAVSDINRDGYPDLYVANDFFERDYLYINNGDGTFTESLEERIRSLSSSSMGSDIADINNDGWPDIYVTDMLPADEKRLKSKMNFESWQEYQENVSKGFHHKFTRNTLQLNRGNGIFSEVGRYAKVHATDWSWAALIADYDNSGTSDIFVTNGIYKDLLDQDYIEQVSNPGYMQRLIEEGERNVILNLMEQMSTTPQNNYLFRNEGDLKFTELAKSWGLEEPGFSTGAAWTDLDNDGDLDLVLNEVNGAPRIYRNRANNIYKGRSWLKVDLSGESTNTKGIGAELHVWADDQYWFREHYLQRGFQSSVEPGFHVGLGENSKIDSLVIRWPDGSVNRHTNIDVPAKLTVARKDVKKDSSAVITYASFPGDLDTSITRHKQLFQEVQINPISDWKHIAYDYNDFQREQLLMHMPSTESSAMCTGDINGDNLDDLYLGGARGQAGVIWVQNSSGQFSNHQPELFQQDATSADADCAFFDATGNGVDDLYVVSGGNSFSTGSSALLDRMYVNNGRGQLQKTDQLLPSTRGVEPGSTVSNQDFTGDGIEDLFVGIRLRPFATGQPVNGYLLEGQGDGTFREVTSEWVPDLYEIGMITDAVWADVTGDQQKELILTGQWMPVYVFEKQGNQFVDISDRLGLSETTGLWNSVAAGDIDGDGRIDLVAGNLGLNSILDVDKNRPIKMWVHDFDRNGMTEHVVAVQKNGEYYPLALRDELLAVIPSLQEKYPDYASYAGQTMQNIFSEQQLSSANTFEGHILESSVFWNRKEGFKIETLPVRAQLAPMFGIHLQDLTGNDRPEIIMGGNLYNVKPLLGPYDASRGVVLIYDNNEWKSYPDEISGVDIAGEIRSIKEIEISGVSHLVVTRYDDSIKVLRINHTK